MEDINALVRVQRWSYQKIWDAFGISVNGTSTGAIDCDRGTAYGEDDYRGHRLSHPVVWNVPYGEFVLPHNNL